MRCRLPAYCTYGAVALEVIKRFGCGDRATVPRWDQKGGCGQTCPEPLHHCFL
jgi:hypothetical protein